MSEWFSISEAADSCNVPPRRISDLIYQRCIDPAELLCKGGRRFLPARMIPTIKRMLSRRAG